MQYPAATDAEIALAQAPHNLLVSGLFLFDLLIAPAAIVLDIGMAGCSSRSPVPVHCLPISSCAAGE